MVQILMYGRTHGFVQKIFLTLKTLCLLIMEGFVIQYPIIGMCNLFIFRDYKIILSMPFYSVSNKVKAIWN